MVRTLALVVVSLALAGRAFAGGPTVEEVSGADPVGKGTLDGLTMDEQGILRLGPTFDAVPLDAPTAWAMARGDAATWVGVGNKAAVVRVAPDGKTTRVALGDGLMVTALAPLPGGAVAAAVHPGARI